MQILGSFSRHGYRDKFKACLQWLVLYFLRSRQLENWGRDEREERRHNWSSLARKFRVPSPSSEGEMVGREEEADRLIPSCHALCSGSQRCVVGARGEKPSQLVHWEKAGGTLSRECLNTMVRLHGGWVRGWPVILLATQECHRVQGFTKALR